MKGQHSRFAFIAVAVVAALLSQASAQYGYYGHGPGGIQHVIAAVDDKGDVIVRQFQFAYPAPIPIAPKEAPKPAPKGAVSLQQPVPVPQALEKPGMRESRLRYKASDLLVMNVEGKPVEADVWQKALSKPSAALMGFLPGSPDKAKSEGSASVTVPANLKDVYKKGTLILYATGRPIDTSGQMEVKGDGPKTPPPQIVLASYQANDTLRFRHKTEFEGFRMMKVQDQDKEGKPIVRDLTIRVSGQSTNTYEVPARYYKVFDGKAKEIAQDKLPKLLAKEKSVLETVGGGTIDPYYLRLLRPDVLIVRAPQPEMVYGAATSRSKPHTPSAELGTRPMPSNSGVTE